jgi:hypothetical protein
LAPPPKRIGIDKSESVYKSNAPRRKTGYQLADPEQVEAGADFTDELTS